MTRRRPRHVFAANVLDGAYRRENRDAGAARRPRSGVGSSSSTKRCCFAASASRWTISSRPSGPGKAWRSFTLRCMQKPVSGAGGAVRGGDARMEALVPASRPRRFAALHARIDKVLDVSIAREVERLESSLLFLATVASAGPFVGLFGTVWGIMTVVPLDRGVEEHVAGRRRAGNRGGAARHRHRPVRRHPRAHRLQQAARRRFARAGAAGELRRRILLDPVAPNRPACAGRAGGLMGGSIGGERT